MTVSVTYWSVAGQGFQVQYDAPGNAYLGGPTVAGSGTGSWQTATAPRCEFGWLPTPSVTHTKTAAVVPSFTRQMPIESWRTSPRLR